MRVPPAAELNAARKAKGLTYQDIMFKLGVGKTAVANWMTGRTRPKARFRAPLLRLLYGYRDVDQTVWIRYHGREYKGTVRSTTERGAWVLFTKRSGKEHLTYVVPTRRAIYLNPEWLAEALAERSLPPVGRIAEHLRTATVTLADADFETQALANTLDRIAGHLTVDRGALDAPRNVVG